MTSISGTAVRVPSVVPDRWVYLRKWCDYGTHAERTWSSAAFVCVAGPRNGYVNFVGLPCFRSPDSNIESDKEAIQDCKDAVDQWLLSLGAEAVPVNEWPIACQTPGPETPADRIPFQLSDRIDQPLETK